MEEKKEEFNTEKEITQETEKEIEQEVAEQDPGVEQDPKENIIKKIYNFLWVSESPTSYIAFVIIAFIVLRFIAFPGFLMVTGYSDVAAVVSGSMIHNSDQFFHNHDSWLEFNGFTKEELSEWPYQNGLDVGDVIFVKSVEAEEINVGDVILFNSPRGQIIHRVVFVNKINDEYFFTTKGDANPGVSMLEKDIPYDNIKGELVSKIPYLGYPKVVFNYMIPNF